MDYTNIKGQVNSAVKFFGNSKVYKFYTGSGTVEIVSGVESGVSRQTVEISGVLRQAKKRDIDGESILVGDWLGFFGADTPIEKGYELCINNERYIVVDNRPVMPGDAVLAYRPVMRRISVYG